MPQLVSARLPDSTAERVRRYARRKQRSVNETIVTALEEWLRLNEFANVEFRDTPDGRRPYMKGSRLPVWWVVKLAKQYDMDAERTAAYFGGHRSLAWVQSALNYYAAFPDEVDEAIADLGSTDDRQILGSAPSLEVIQVEAVGDSSAS